MREMKGIIKGSYVLGQTIIDGLYLQLLFILYTLKGAVLFGFFPALAAVFQVIYLFFVRGKEYVKIREEYGLFYRKYFKMSNYLGYTMLAVGGFLTFDLQVNKTYVQSAIVHYGLILLFILFLGTCLFVFPALCRYELTYKQYLRQAVTLFFTNLTEAIAMLVGTFVIMAIYVGIPILLVIAGVPLIIVPVMWFALQGMKKTEARADTL